METGQVSIEITNEDMNLISSIKEKMGCVSLSHRISRVPQHLISEENEEKLYYPSLVSVGPFHRSNHKLKAAEEHKWRYLNAFLSRKPHNNLDTCITALRGVENKVRSFYAEPIDIGSDDFVEMLLVDGCFIVELFLEFSIKGLRRRDDPFFISDDTIQRLRRDLILFENQIPYFVLEQIVFHHLVPLPLFELALRFFRNLIPGHVHGHNSHIMNIVDKNAPQAHHLLDLIRQHYLPTVPKVKVISSSVVHDHHHVNHRATSLVACGVRVEKSVFSESPSDIVFVKGVLKIPCLEINAYTEVLLRNLVAMERWDPRCSKHVTSYAVLMKRLVRSRRDVRLLGGKGILGGSQIREGEVVQLFQRVNVEINEEEDFYYKGVCERIDGYEKKVWWSWKSVRQSYNKSHLGIAGLSLGILFLVLLFTAALISALYFLFHHFH